MIQQFCLSYVGRAVRYFHWGNARVNSNREATSASMYCSGGADVGRSTYGAFDALGPGAYQAVFAKRETPR
jgi:hypothetical protein